MSKPWPALPEEPDYEAMNPLARAAARLDWHRECQRVHAERERILRGMLEEAMGLIEEHNHAMQVQCGIGDQEAVRCQYRPYFVNNGRRCTDCPVYDKIDDPRLASLRKRHEEIGK